MNIIIIGDRGVGKTTLCERLAAELEARGFSCGGVLCPAVVVGGKQKGKVAVNVATKERRMIASLEEVPEGIPVGDFSISLPGLEFAKRVIHDSVDCDVIFIDELGPLEFEGRGVMEAARPIIESRLNVVVVTRKHLMAVFFERFRDQGFSVFEVSSSNRDSLVEDLAGFIEDESRNR